MNQLYELWKKARDHEDEWGRIDSGLKGRAEGTLDYAWAVPTSEAIEAIVKRSPIIEIGAGRGYWAELVAQAGGDIIAFDHFPPIRDGVNHFHKKPGLFFNVQDGDPDKLAEYPDRALFLCWPPMSPMADHCLKFRPHTVIYVGEDDGGCNADEDFFTTLEKHYTKVEDIDIPQWWGIHDYMSIWELAEKGS